MTKPIRHVGVIGAGVMGGAIAAHLANAGLRVRLLDIVPPNLSDAEKSDKAARDRFAAGGLDKARAARPAAFFHKAFARLVSTGNLEDDLGQLAECDLVIEAIVERLDVKRALLDKLEGVLAADCIVASNTSGLRIADMVQGRSDAFKKRFLVMHFFNPVRYMKLLELVAGPDTDPTTMARVAHLGQETLGKGVVYAKDTPNFIGNRIGMHGMMTTIHQMVADGLTPEDVDAITGVPMAHPKSASFRTADVVGLDTFAHVADNCYAALTGDEERDVFKLPDFVRAMLEKKLLGDKTKGGFYKKVGDALQTFDPQTLAYRDKGGDPAIRKAMKAYGDIEDPKERVRKLAADQGKPGQFAWKVLSRGLAYAARRIGEIADDVASIDAAMRWGYNWELGPFETWDALGFVPTLERMLASGVDVPKSVLAMRDAGATAFYREDGAVFDLLSCKYVERKADPRTRSIEIWKKGATVVLKNDGGEAWDMGDGVLGLTFKTKANSIDPDVISLIPRVIERAESDFSAIVLANRGEHFCVGANLLLVMMAASQGQWADIQKLVGDLQSAMQRMKYARVPVVAAPYGMTLGGGLELCLASSSVQAAAETYAGLVEVGVGIIPGGAGTVNSLWRALESVPEGQTVSTYDVVTNVFKNIALAKVATSADEAKEIGYFRRGDGVSFDRARQLWEAKERALGMARSGYKPPIPRAYRLPGESGIATLQMMIGTLVDAGQASAHDAKIAGKLATVLCGGVGGAAREVTEEEVLTLEREAFVSLVAEPKSQERMQYMLMNNKPLRN